MQWNEIKKSRRFNKDGWHPYGWVVDFHTTVKHSNGNKVRVYASGVGVDRFSAIGNAIRFINNSNFKYYFEKNL